jgi:hypothetical protein
MPSTVRAVIASTRPVNGPSWLLPEPSPVGRNGGVSEHVAESARQTRQQLLSLVDRLIAEFPDRPAGVVIAQVALAKDRQSRTDVRSRRDLVAAVEHAARRRILSAKPA